MISILLRKTVASGAAEQEIIEKIDIGGISLIRAAAKNFKDVLIVSEMSQYAKTLEILNTNGASTSMARKKKLCRLMHLMFLLITILQFLIILMKTTRLYLSKV